MMRTILALAIGLVMVGCNTGPGDTPGPTDPAGKAMDNNAAESAIKSAPPELQDKIREARAKSMAQAGGPPPKK